MTGLEKAFNIYNCAANNFKHAHWHAAGPRFDRIHKLSEQFYKRLIDHTDTLAELILQHDEKLNNPNESATLLGWEPLHQDNIDWDLFCDVAVKILNAVDQQTCELFCEYQNEEDIKNFAGDLIQYWRKELFYKFKRRQC